MAFYVDPDCVCWRCKECACYDECYYDLDVNLCDAMYDCEGYCPCDFSCFISDKGCQDVPL